MTDLEQIFNLPPYGLHIGEKQQLLIEHLNLLNAHHSKSCNAYRNIQCAFGVLGREFSIINEFPYIPIRLFKELNLKSIKDEDVVKTLTSSGTTSSRVSKIYLDKATSRYQTKALASIVQDFIGKKRLPMLIIDSISTIKNRRLFSARGAGILGFSNFGRNHLYVLDENMNMNADDLGRFLAEHSGEKILLFGFTYIVWKYFLKELEKMDPTFDLSDGILIHSGGWKKLIEKSIDNATFKQSFKEICGIGIIHNFYGTVEQIGSVYMECESGYFHAPIFSDIIIRDPLDWSDAGFGREGVIELLSILPYSYPGHILLTEDLGEIIGEDDCPCGRKGKFFRVIGRIPKAELRGCSDTYALEDNNAI